MRKLFALGCVLSAALIIPAAARPRRQFHWQWSEAPSVRIGVRDKNDDLHGYEATFVVTAERTGRRREQKVKVGGDDFGYLNFPADFAAYDWASHATRFEWTCRVKGGVVVRGRFVLATTTEIEGEEKRAPRRKRGRG